MPQPSLGHQVGRGQGSIRSRDGSAQRYVPQPCTGARVCFFPAFLDEHVFFIKIFRWITWITNNYWDFIAFCRDEDVTFLIINYQFSVGFLLFQQPLNKNLRSFSKTAVGDDREQFTLGESRFRPRNQLVKSQTFRQLRIPTKLDSLSSGSFMVNPYFCWLNPYFCWLNPVLLVNFSIFDAFKIWNGIHHFLKVKSQIFPFCWWFFQSVELPIFHDESPIFGG